MPAVATKTAGVKKTTPTTQGNHRAVKAKVFAESKVTQHHSISDKAMLVDLTVHRWTPSIVDRKASEEVSKSHGSDLSMGRFQKDLIDRAALAEINSLTNEIRKEHWFRTLPWTDGGVRILSQTGYFDYMKKIGELRDKILAANVVFLDKFEEHKRDAKKRLGSLFIEADYPTRSQLAARYGVELVVRPVPDFNDFRVDLGDEETERVKAAMRESVQATVETAMKDVWTRLRDVVQKASDKLKAYTRTDDGVQHGFRDSLIINIVELLDIVPTLNVTGDPALLKFAADIRAQVTLHSPEVLRDDDKVRADVAQRADEILSKMSGYLN